MSEIDLLLTSFARAFAATGDIAPWPAHLGTIFPYFSDLEGVELVGKLRTLSDRKMSKKTMTKELLVGPSVTKGTLLMDPVIGMKMANPPIDKEERIWFVETILDMLKEWQPGDIFCLDGTNLLISPGDAQDLFIRSHWLSLKMHSDLAHKVFRASASAQALIWGLFFYGWTDIGFESHGPYDVVTEDGKKHRLLVRDFFDLKPTLLWEHMEVFPYSRLRIMTLHYPHTFLSIDIFNHLTTKEDLLDTTTAACVEVEGVSLKTPGEIETLTREILWRVAEQHRVVKAMSKEEIVRKFIESRYYALRKWRLYFGEDWRPPAVVLERVSEWGLIELPKSAQPDPEALVKSFDPRNNFVLGKYL